MTLLQRMDQLVYATRLDRIVFIKFQPHSFRWTPLLVIAALIAGYALMARTADVPDRSFFVGWLLFYGACLTAGLLRIFGPRFTGTELNPVDEREMMVKFRAYARSGVVLASLAMLGCFYIAVADLWRLWQPHAINDWVSLGFGFQAAGMLLPTWIASWLEPRLTADQEI